MPFRSRAFSSAVLAVLLAASLAGCLDSINDAGEVGPPGITLADQGVDPLRCTWTLRVLSSLHAQPVTDYSFLLIAPDGERELFLGADLAHIGPGAAADPARIAAGDRFVVDSVSAPGRHVFEVRLGSAEDAEAETWHLERQHAACTPDPDLPLAPSVGLSHQSFDDRGCAWTIRVSSGTQAVAVSEYVFLLRLPSNATLALEPGVELTHRGPGAEVDPPYLRVSDRLVVGNLTESGRHTLEAVHLPTRVVSGSLTVELARCVPSGE